MEKKLVELQDVTLKINNDIILENFSIAFEDNKFYSLLGPSGCGKTTTLNLLAGFLFPQNGKVIFEGKDITSIHAAKREVNTVFQDYSLFNHLSVYENVAFGLKVKKHPNKDIEKKVLEMLKLVKLEKMKNKMPKELSGGQKQRVAIARALVLNPKILLLDEPLSALDLELRQEMQYMLKDIQRKLKITFIFITHDQEEALFLSDYIYVLSDGKVMQKGTPEDIYDEPNCEFVAKFIGEANIIDGKMKQDYLVEFSNIDFKCVDKGFGTNKNIKVVIRPEDVIMCEWADQKENVVQNMKIKSRVFKGAFFEYQLIDENESIWISQTKDYYETNIKVDIMIKPEGIHVIDE